MTNVYLYGALGRKFGFRWSLEVSSPGEAIRAIVANRPDFQRYLNTHSLPGYQVFIGKDPIANEHGLVNPVGRQCVKIVPVLQGAAKSGVFNVIIGVLLIITAVALVATGNPGAALPLGSIGLSLLIGGVTQLLAKAPNLGGPKEEIKNSPSALFNGPVNTVTQGHPVPIGYGRLRIGSQVISAGIGTVDIPIG